MYPSDGELSFNKTWAWLQFRVYDMDFFTMFSIITNIKNDNHSPLPFNDINQQKCYFKENRYTPGRIGLMMLQIEINEEQYKQLKNANPSYELK